MASAALNATDGERAYRKPRQRSKPKHQRFEQSVHPVSSSLAMQDTRDGTNYTSMIASNGQPDPSMLIDKRSDEGPSYQRSPRVSPIPQPPSTGNVFPSAGTAAPNTTSASMEFTTGKDFIPFDFSDDENEKEEGKEPPPVKSVGKGKGRESDDRDMRGGKNGLKRSAWEIEVQDEYSNKKQRTDASSRLTPWVADVDWDNCRNLAELLHQEVKAFAKYISPTPEEHKTRGMIVTIITRAIQAVWRDARVFPFGSYETKLYLPLGDIDIVILSRAMETVTKRKVLYRLAQVMRSANITDNVQVIGKAKVPIIKFVTSHGRFAVDISINQMNGIEAGRIINGMVKELPALRALVMVVKSFLSQRSLNEVYSGGISSYAVVCMAVSFLQMHPKIRAGEIDPSENLGVLVMEFFELYGHYFNYDNTGISLQHGGTYFNKIKRGWDNSQHPSLLSIEDPVDTTNDLAKNSFNITRVRKTMAGAYEVLTAVALTRSRVLISKARGEYTNLRGPYRRTREDDRQSLLGSVMGVTQETINHRRMVNQLYEQNTLQNLLGAEITAPRVPSGPSLQKINQRRMRRMVKQSNEQNTLQNSLRLPPYRPPETTAPRVSSGMSNTPLQQQSRNAVDSGLGEADMDLEDSDKDFVPSHVKFTVKLEENRYFTRSKRRRIGSLEPNGTISDPVFVEESDEGEPFVPQKRDLSISREGSTQQKDERNERIEARRAYWASKGMSGGGLEESD